MAPVLAITGMVATVVDNDSSFDPVGEITKPIATGPSLVRYEDTGERNGGRQNELKGQERAGA